MLDKNVVCCYLPVCWLIRGAIVSSHLENEIDIFVTEMGKTVSQLQYFEFLIALFLNIQLFWYIVLGVISQHHKAIWCFLLKVSSSCQTVTVLG